MICVKEMETYANIKGVKVIKHTNWQYQLIGRYTIEVYPTTGRCFIKGLNHSSKLFDSTEAVDFATGDKLPVGVHKSHIRPNRMENL